MQSTKELIQQVETAIEGFLVTHPISKISVHDYLLERMTDSIFPNEWFAMDLTTGRDFPQETHEYFAELAVKYGGALLNKAFDLYVQKHRREIIRDGKKASFHKEGKTE